MKMILTNRLVLLATVLTVIMNGNVFILKFQYSKFNFHFNITAMVPALAFDDNWKYSRGPIDEKPDKDVHPRLMEGSWLGNKIRPVMNNHPFGYTVFCMLIGVVVVVGFACFFQMVRIRINRAPSTTSVPSFTNTK